VLKRAGPLQVGADARCGISGQSRRRLFQTRIGGPNTLQGEYLVAPDGQRFLLDTPIRDVTPPITVILNWHPPA
jgi:hypothetical protein